MPMSLLTAESPFPIHISLSMGFAGGSVGKNAAAANRGALVIIMVVCVSYRTGPLDRLLTMDYAILDFVILDHLSGAEFTRGLLAKSGSDAVSHTRSDWMAA